MSRHIKLLLGVGIALFVVLGFWGLRAKPASPVRLEAEKGNIYPDLDPASLSNALSDSDNLEQVNRSFERFLQQWGLAGVSIAIAKNGRLIYTRGVGYSNVEERLPMQPYNTMRVASVSKLITATAVMKLVEENRLTLDSRVFGANGILNDSAFLAYKDNRVEDITVNNLLNHSAGWTSRWGDHMFIKEVISKELGKELPITLNDMVVFALSKKLHFTPGSRSSYSNLGYGILQLVIERVTGERYEEYVKANIFDPLNIHDAYLAENWDSLRHSNEARYYEVREAEEVIAFDGSPGRVLRSRGGNDVKTLGAAGGWVISSVNLVKFILSIDGDGSFPDILSQQSVATMVATDDKLQPLGWRRVMDGKLWRSGSLAGTSSLAVSRSDGYAYVFIANSSPWKGARFPYIVDRFMDKTLPKLDTLHCGDLFYYGMANRH